MSFDAMKRVYASHLEHSLRFLAITLAWFANDDGSRVFPSVETLSDYLGVSDRQVRAGLSRLRDLEVLLVEQSGGGTGRSTRYRINLPVLEQIPPPRKHRVVSSTTVLRHREKMGRKPGSLLQGLTSVNIDESSVPGSVPQGQTLKCTSANPEAGFRQTLKPASAEPGSVLPRTLKPTSGDQYIDPSIDPPVDPSRSVHKDHRARANAAARDSLADKSKHPSPQSQRLADDPAALERVKQQLDEVKKQLRIKTIAPPIVSKRAKARYPRQ